MGSSSSTAISRSHSGDSTTVSAIRTHSVSSNSSSNSKYRSPSTVLTNVHKGTPHVSKSYKVRIHDSSSDHDDEHSHDQGTMDDGNSDNDGKGGNSSGNSILFHRNYRIHPLPSNAFNTLAIENEIKHAPKVSCLFGYL